MTQEARCYYDCPIKAAFMNWYHGIEYTNDFSSGYEYHNDGTNSRDFRVEGISRLYIHPESLPLLQPQVGDVILIHEIGQNYSNDGVELYHAGMFVLCDEGYEADDIDLFIKPSCLDGKIDEKYEQISIINRNGKSFIMPERGE